MQKQNRTSISVSKQTYEKLKMLGYTGQSFNDVVERLLDTVIIKKEK
jgi:predicted CopG family antitoxin